MKIKKFCIIITLIISIMFSFDSAVEAKSITFDQFAHNALYACLQHGGRFRRRMRGTWTEWCSGPSTTGTAKNTLPTIGKFAMLPIVKDYNTSKVSLLNIAADTTKETPKCSHGNTSGHTVPKHAMFNSANRYVVSKSGTLTTAPEAGYSERRVAYVFAHNGGWRSSSQWWIWGNIAMVNSVLNSGGSASKVNKSAKTSFLTKVAKNMEDNTQEEIIDDTGIKVSSINNANFLTKLAEGEDGEGYENLTDDGSLSEEGLNDPNSTLYNDEDLDMEFDELNKIVEPEDAKKSDFDNDMSNTEKGPDEKLPEKAEDLTKKEKIPDIKEGWSPEKKKQIKQDKVMAESEKEEEQYSVDEEFEGDPNEVEEDRLKEDTKEDSDESDDDLDELLVDTTATPEDNKSAVKQSVDQYIKFTKAPKLENLGENPLYSYNDIVGPFTLNYDKDHKTYAVNRIVEIQITYLDDPTHPYNLTASSDPESYIIIQGDKKLKAKEFKCDPNDTKSLKKCVLLRRKEPFYIINPFPEREVIDIKFKQAKRIKYWNVRYMVLTGVGYDIVGSNPHDATIYWDGKAQKLVEIHSSSHHKTYYGYLDIPVVVKKGDLVLTKKGIYTTREAEKDEYGNFLLDENGEKIYKDTDREELLPNMSFKVFYDYCYYGNNHYEDNPENEGKKKIEKYIKNITKMDVNLTIDVEFSNSLLSPSNIKQMNYAFVDKYLVEYTDDIKEAKVYTTDDKGEIEIANLIAGRTNSSGTKFGPVYRLLEVDGGENYYYIDPLKIEKGTSTYTLENVDKSTEDGENTTDEENTTDGENTEDGEGTEDESRKEYEDKGISVGHRTVNGKQYCTIENITIFYDSKSKNDGSPGEIIDTYILIENDRTSGNLLIEKYDETFPKNVKLKDVQFKIKLVRSAHLDAEGNEDSEHDLKQENKWLKSIEATRETRENNPSPNRIDSNNPTLENITDSGGTTDENTTDENSVNDENITNSEGNTESENGVRETNETTEENTTESSGSTGGDSGSSGDSLDNQDDDRANVYDYSEFLYDEYLTDDPNEAGIFTTNEEGLIKIKCIINGDYEIYEVKPAEGYDITRQWYYGKDETNPECAEWVDYGKEGEEENYSDWGKNEECYPSRDDHGLVTISTGDNYFKPVYSNRKIVAKISGNIWEDVPKGNKSSGKYDSLNYMGSPDTTLSEDDVVKVKLYIRKTEIVNGDITRIDSLKGDNRYDCVAETTVDSSGHWEIGVKGQTGPSYSRDNKSNDIYYWELADGYIEYIYNNQQYVCTDIFAKVQGSIQESVERNSKAQEEMLTEEELDDRKLSGVNDSSQTQRKNPRKCNYNKRCNSCIRRNSTRYNRT